MSRKMLTPKQRRFVEEYLIDLNATQAAIRTGYSKKTAYSIGQENLSKPEITEAIAEQRVKVSDAAEVDAAWVLTRLKKEAELANTAASRVSALDKLAKHLGRVGRGVGSLAHGRHPRRVLLSGKPGAVQPSHDQRWHRHRHRDGRRNLPQCSGSGCCL